MKDSLRKVKELLEQEPVPPWDLLPLAELMRYEYALRHVPASANQSFKQPSNHLYSMHFNSGPKSMFSNVVPYGVPAETTNSSFDISIGVRQPVTTRAH